MASLPSIQSLSVEGLLDEEGGVDTEKLLRGLNQFMGPTHNALNGQLSVENLQAEWLEFEVAAGTEAERFPVFASLKRLTYRPLGVFLAELREKDSNAVTSAGHLDWDWRDKDGKPHVLVRNIPDLETARRYRGRLLVVGR